MMMNTPMQLALAQQAVLGEGPAWHAGRWWWTDIEASTLNAWAPGSTEPLGCRLPDRLGSFAHTASGRVLLGLSKGLSLATLDAGMNLVHLQSLVAVDAAERRTRINDGRCDRRGYFVFGTMNEAGEPRPIGSFYQYSMQHGLRRLALPAVAIANSVCFSLDGRTMYFCDTLERRILQCAYDAERAQVADVRLFAALGADDASAWPDGSVIDAEGCLWNAQWGAGRAVRYAPDGRPLSSVSLPAAHASCPALGGPDGRQLLLTSARMKLSPQALAAEPLSGSLFTLELPRPLAVADTLFDDLGAPAPAP